MNIKRVSIIFIGIALFFSIIPILITKSVKGKYFIEWPLSIILATIFIIAAILVFWLDRKDIKLKNKKIEYAILLIIFAILCNVVNLINNLTDPSRARFLALPIDSAIPFLPIFVIFYLFYLWYVLATFGYAWYDRKLFSKVVFSWIFLITTSLAIYVIVPTGVIKPPFVPHSIIGNWTFIVQSMTSQFNAVPSMHASGVVLTLLTLFHFKKGRVLVLPIMATLASTVLLKQHFIIDIIAGLAFGIFVYILFFKINKAPAWNKEAFWKNLHEKNPWLAKFIKKS
jgi:membrane-associated phospholipid phosphatase